MNSVFHFIDEVNVWRHDSHMSITAIVEKGIIKLPVHVPDGTRVEITLPGAGTTAQAGNALAWIEKFAGSVEGPADLATEHDHYTHGTPKRSGARSRS